MVLSVFIPVSAEEMLFIPADDAKLAYSDYARMTFIASPGASGMKMARFDRFADIPGKGYQWDNPGARLRFRTNAQSITVHLYYNEKHISTSARNGKGVFFIDGKSDAAWTYTSVQTKTVRNTETLLLPIASPAPNKMHNYEIVLPYGDSVDILGISVSKGAHFEKPTPPPLKRLAAYGDSITHGFAASDVSKTYAFLLAQKKGMQLVDMGLGGCSSSANDGALIASLSCDAVLMLIGVNDWQCGISVAKYQANIEGFIKNLRAKQPSAPLIIITPLWVPPSWKPEKTAADLEGYREVLRKIVAGSHDANIKLVEGPDLIDHDPKYFDSCAVHPNDAGFAMMAERLAAQLKNMH